MLECRRVTFGYRATQRGERACDDPASCSDSLVLRDFDMSVKPGERVFLSAPSGYGKTTLCKILSGYLQSDSGDVVVDGDPLPRRGLCPVQLIGQHPENMLDPRMRMGASLNEAGECDAHLIQHLGIEQRWLSRYPHELSGGELQRFCIARALTANPSYLIADEISTMLDALTQARVWHVILDEAQKRNFGILFTTHNRVLADRIATREIDMMQVDRCRMQ